MIQQLGALFVIGVAMTVFISTMKCGRFDAWKSAQYGAAWGLIPAVVYGLTNNTYAMVVSTWVPTLSLVYWTEQNVCEKPAA